MIGKSGQTAIKEGMIGKSGQTAIKEGMIEKSPSAMYSTEREQHLHELAQLHEIAQPELGPLGAQDLDRGVQQAPLSRHRTEVVRQRLGARGRRLERLHQRVDGGTLRTIRQHHWSREHALAAGGMSPSPGG